MIKSKTNVLIFAISMLFGSFSANAVCTGCPILPNDDFDDNFFGNYTAVVKQYVTTTNRDGQQTGYMRYTTLTGSTLQYCQQQVSAALSNPNVSIVQFCRKD